MINTVILQGRFTRDPEIRRGNTTFAKFTLAVKDDFKADKTHFIECNAWGSVAERIQRYFQKGDPVIVGGSLEQQKWTDKDGNQREKVVVKANQYWFTGAKPDGRKPQEQEEDEPAPVREEEFRRVEEDDDLPFE